MNEVHLPLEEAVALAVKENIERDIRCGLISNNEAEIDREVYEEEVRCFFSQGEGNYYPEFPDHHLIFAILPE
jgi:hypothetical protein